MRRLLLLAKMLLSGQYPQQRGSLPIQKTVHKTTILMWRTVAQRMILTRSSVEEEHSFDTEGGGGEGSFDMIGGSGEDEPGNKAICFYAIANAAGEFYFLETTLEIVEVQE